MNLSRLYLVTVFAQQGTEWDGLQLDHLHSTGIREQNNGEIIYVCIYMGPCWKRQLKLKYFGQDKIVNVRSVNIFFLEQILKIVQMKAQQYWPIFI